jgi:hypothetical protein
MVGLLEAVVKLNRTLLRRIPWCGLERERDEDERLWLRM